VLAASIIRALIALIMEAEIPSETSVNFYQNTWGCSPVILHVRRKVPSDAKKVVSDPCSQLWLNFVNSTLPLFHDAIRKAEAQEVTAVESCMILRHLKDKLNSKKEENFIPVSVRELLSSLEEDGSYSKTQFLNVSHDFYSTAIQYSNAWGVHFDDIHHAECMLLKTVPQREKLKRLYISSLLKQMVLQLMKTIYMMKYLH
jgi:hypothetical protein